MEQSSRVKTIVFLIALIAVAAVGLFWLTLRRVDSSWLITLPDLISREYRADMSGVELLSVEDIYNDIVLLPARDNQLRIEYLENNFEHYALSADGQSIGCRFIPGDHYFKYGLPMRSGDSRLVIYLPREYRGGLALGTTSGDISVTLPGCAADYTLLIDSASGMLSLPEGCDSGSRIVTLTSSSGNISVTCEGE
ncbi:MAG: DUF4097 domain-containing protein [Clostridia bacterium]|nr:DUF4097 domain-containing protein [Clostridia bacterium]